MQLVSIQVGRIQTCEGARGPERTAIDKRLVAGSVKVGPLGLEGDEIADLRHHGGPERAVLFGSRDTYPVLEVRLGRTLSPGALGENLTVEGLSDADVCIGDRIRVGRAQTAAEFEVASPRSPCGTLARHLRDPGAVEFIGSPHRAGWYARVVREGCVSSGDAVSIVTRPNPGWTIARIARAKRGSVSRAEAGEIAALSGLGSDWVAKFRDRASAKA